MKWICIIMMALMLSVSAVTAQEIDTQENVLEDEITMNDLGAEDEDDYAYGTIQTISADAIVIAEYDYDDGEEYERTYRIDDATEFYNAESFEDLSEGDAVEVCYAEDTDGAYAIYVAKDE